ncbi:hypothetical protein E2C01_026238 [Portunus trituberculatus]|uniref:Uncharacterized protein n=1 Tax=Portunus trituberculatus TaxID=210409 RepID=A0A5B7EK64_PORTR|nr:hypothetical protein [Portunus trituberculatus]
MRERITRLDKHPPLPPLPAAFAPEDTISFTACFLPAHTTPSPCHHPVPYSYLSSQSIQRYYTLMLLSHTLSLIVCFLSPSTALPTVISSTSSYPFHLTFHNLLLSSFHCAIFCPKVSLTALIPSTFQYHVTCPSRAVRVNLCRAGGLYSSPDLEVLVRII